MVYFLFQGEKKTLKFNYISVQERKSKNVFLTIEERQFLLGIFKDNVKNYEDKFPKSIVREKYITKEMSPLRRNLRDFSKEICIHYIYEFIRNVIKNKKYKSHRK